MKLKICGLFLAAYLNAMLIDTFPTILANNKIFIYGKVTTTNGETYQGQIRWGKEEAFWFDHFNSSKPKNEFLKFLDDKEMDALEEKDMKNKCGWSFGWNSNSWNDNTHSFACHFGDIKSIEPRRGDKVNLVLKDGSILRLDGGSNDIGAKIWVNDNEIGTVKIDWDNIDKVEFMETPTDLRSAFGEPLYGTVKTYGKEFTGYLQWDHDERLSLDELNGDTESGSFDIEFGNIASIEKSRRGSRVTLRSGRNMMMFGSNDVCDDNRGIIVNIPGQGRVDISWDEFEMIEFTTTPKSNNIAYSSYGAPETIKGEVTDSNGKTFSGQIVFDLDEEYLLEMLDGEQEGMEFLIPFRYVKSINPRSRETSRVELVNGTKIELGDTVDVSNENDGVLVFQTEEDYAYIPWSEIEQINFN